MQIITENPPKNVMAIGKFESMHLGHQKLIHKAKEKAAELGLPTVLLSFVPHPFTVLGDRDYVPLFTTEEVVRLVRRMCPVDYLLQYPFTQEFSKLEPQEFCQILFAKLGVKALFVGQGYRFGAERAGSVDLLVSEAKRFGASVSVVETEKLGEAQISTSRIRRLIGEGNFSEASKLLGFAYPL